MGEEKGITSAANIIINDPLYKALLPVFTDYYFNADEPQNILAVLAEKLSPLRKDAKSWLNKCLESCKDPSHIGLVSYTHLNVNGEDYLVSGFMFAYIKDTTAHITDIYAAINDPEQNIAPAKRRVLSCENAQQLIAELCRQRNIEVLTIIPSEKHPRDYDLIEDLGFKPTKDGKFECNTAAFLQESLTEEKQL